MTEPLGERVRALEIMIGETDAEFNKANARIGELRAEMFMEFAKLYVRHDDHEKDIKAQSKFQNFLTGAAAGISFIMGALVSLFGPLKDMLHK